MISFIIVDDETASHDIIQEYASSVSYLSYKTSCYNAFEAMEYLQNNRIDLIFLDINMPKLSGFDFLKTLSNPPKIIITTAYKEYALEGYELDIEDYLLKPFDFLRFVKSVNKVFESSSVVPKTASVGNGNNSAKIFIKDDKKYYQIELDDLLFIRAYGNYVKLQLLDKMIVSHQTLSSLLMMLPENEFIRVHRSYAVSVDKIDIIEGNRIHLQDHVIPVGKLYKMNVNRLFN